MSYSQHRVKINTHVLAIYKGNNDQLRKLFDRLNSRRPSIKFTIEKVENNKISFLDILIKKVGNSLVFSVYRKLTHTDRYINRVSCHPPEVFKSLNNCLKKRALIDLFPF